MRFKSIIAASGLATALAALAAMPAFAQAPKATGAPAAATVSVPVCAQCHEQAHKSTLLSAHGARNDASGSACQACHGDASNHLKDPQKNKMVSVLTAKDSTAEQKSAVCLNCHGKQRQLAFWQAGMHRKVDVACTDCHGAHAGASASNPKMLKANSFAAAPYTTTFRQLAYQTCVGCHRDVRSEILKPSHHPTGRDIRWP